MANDTHVLEDGLKRWRPITHVCFSDQAFASSATAFFFRNGMPLHLPLGS